jgi:lysophospholipase
MKLRLIFGVLALSLCACQRGGGEAFVAPRLAPGAPTRAWAPQGWAWGLIRIAERPPQRYGVSAPTTAPIGDIVILPSYGESAEWWFETARDLNREGYTVWILDSEGQGGSGRYTLQRDLGHTPDFGHDVDGLQTLIQRVVRPSPDRPVVLIASGTAALTALSATEQGVVAERMILSAPSELSVGSSGFPATAASIGLTTLRASGGLPWKREAPARTPREKTAFGWAIANPDLRMGGPSTGWLKARQALQAAAKKPEALSRIAMPVTIITSQGSGALSCDHIARCMVRPLPARLPYHIEEDHVRAAWISALIGELGTDHAA